MRMKCIPGYGQFAEIIVMQKVAFFGQRRHVHFKPNTYRGKLMGSLQKYNFSVHHFHFDALNQVNLMLWIDIKIRIIWK